MPLNAFQAAVKLLGAHDRTAADLRARLCRKGFTPVAIEAAIERAQSLGFVDDLRTASARAERLLARGCSRALTAAKLEAAGVPAESIAIVLRDAPADRLLLRVAVERRFGRRDGRPEQVGRFLAAQGFDPELIADFIGRSG